MAFGESRTDTAAISELAAGLRPDLPKPSLRLRPIILSRSANQPKRASAAQQIAGLVRAELAAGRQVRAVIAHRDLDKVETDETSNCYNEDGSSGNARALRDEIAVALAPIRMPIAAIAAVPAFETEAWWMLWPDALAAHRSGWRRLQDRSGQRVDRISNAKETLRRELRPQTGAQRVPDYAESDGPLVARKVVELGLVRNPKGVSVAYSRFSAEILAL